MLVLLLGTHLYFTFRLGLIQKWIPLGIKLSISKQEDGSGTISPFAALSTALAATIGTGNIIGISTAIAIGGPGSVFWCWITGVLGIATCYSECFLSVKYRVQGTDGSYIGGPMYILKNVLHLKTLSILFAVFTVFASLGVGCSVQSNSISAALTQQFKISSHLIGIVVSIIAGFVIIGGVKQIARVCTFLVPFMSIFYVIGCLYILCINHYYILDSIRVIFLSAFSPKSFIGGSAGTLVIVALRTGISKGLFTNEAGLGSMPMSSATAKTNTPVYQGLVSMTGVFWDTVVICAITGIVIVSSMLKSPSSYKNIASDRLCFISFGELPFAGELVLAISLVLFAFATIIGWCYYGECGIRYLFGERGVKSYQITYMVFIYLGAIMSLDLVWNLSDLLNSLMAIPNLLSLWLLRTIIIKDTSNVLKRKI
ncbi:MAG: alanine/glycine:cation symporter family protein [Lachnospiraceae bacterium]|nr:alanine/glycine:cation symporter family protein [Lachnospiraceae bacterium]